VYSLVVLFASSGRGDEHEAAEWIHKAHRFGQHGPDGQHRYWLVDALERILREPEAFVAAFEPLLDDDDPWVRALARLQLGRMRVMSGQGSREADEQLEMALAEFTALGERFGISFALTELAERMAVRGELPAACEHYEQAIAVLHEVGAPDDVIRMRARQAQLCWVIGDHESSAAALAEAQRCAERVTWPQALAELAFAKAELARWNGDAEGARRHVGGATTMLGDEAEQASIRVMTHDLLGYLVDDLNEARAHRAAAYEAASEGGHAPVIAQVLVGVADLALRRGQHEHAARLLAASAEVRGLPDRSSPDVARIEQTTRRQLGDTRFSELVRPGTQVDWAQLVDVTLRS
jgi:hypothetical protein